jgi:DNA-binding CsgD family transcriptional regulator
LLRLLGQGLNTGQIGQRSRLGSKTVEAHRLNIRRMPA